MKVIVITGSTRGIGLGLADAFLERDCAVCISGRNQQIVDQIVSSFVENYPSERLFGLACDVTNPEQIQSLWDGAVEHFGQVDIWINNAGIANELSDFRELTPDSITAVVETNVLGTLHGSRVAINGLIAQGFGALYNMEGHGSNGRKQEGLTLYGTTKAALKYFTDCLVDEVKGSPIIVGSLRPGMVWTDLVSEQFAENPEVLERSKGVLNIIMDKVDTVTPWLADQILANDKNGIRITWLNRRKMASRFMMAPFSKRQIID